MCLNLNNMKYNFVIDIITYDVVGRVHTHELINFHPHIPKTRVLVYTTGCTLIKPSKSVALKWECCQISCPVRGKGEEHCLLYGVLRPSM